MSLRISAYKKLLQHLNIVFICTDMQKIATRLCKNCFTVFRILKKMRLVVLTQKKIPGIDPSSLTRFCIFNFYEADIR